MKTVIRAEWEQLKDVVIHRPGVEMFFGVLSPFSFLYEREFSVSKAVKEHAALERTLILNGAKVRKLKETVVELIRKDSKLFERIREFAAYIVRFRGPKKEIERARKEFRSSLMNFDEETIFNILVLQPSFYLERSRKYRTVVPRVVLEVPLANLFFMRDQQAVTDKGVVVGRLAKPQRRLETIVTGTLFELMGVKIAYRVSEPGTFEGGDFIPAMKFALIGVGERTNINGARQVMKEGMEFDEVALVSQPSHPLIPDNRRDPMINMHLDTYFNIASSNVAVGCVPLLKLARVEVYKKKGSIYQKEGKTNLFDFIISKGFKIINITTLEQMCYASNFLCVNDGRIICVDVRRIAKRVLRNLQNKANLDRYRYRNLFEHVEKEYEKLESESNFFPSKEEVYRYGIKADVVKLEEITGGYGGAHCMTAALSRG
jgi:arginine deiminase